MKGLTRRCSGRGQAAPLSFDVMERGAMSSSTQISPETRKRLIHAAIQATTKAFLTKPGGTRYGAAVLTSSGQIHTAGQYSSWNHVTNVHAEMAAIVVATMAGDPDVVYLALASNRAEEEPARPCGVCREFINEHAVRIGRDIIVLMTNRDGTKVEEVPLSELLPLRWSPASLREIAEGLEWQRHLCPFSQDERRLRYGDMVQTRGRFLSMVWAPQWVPGVALLKVKYDADGPKLPHSFSEYDAYCDRLRELDLERDAPWGVACLVEHGEIEAVVPTPPLHNAKLVDLRPLVDCLAEADLDPDCARLTASRACGMDKLESDFDVVVTLDPERLVCLRDAVSRALSAGALKPPISSNTWEVLARTGRPANQLMAEKRFLETFLTKGGVKCSLIYVREEDQEPVFSSSPRGESLLEVEGRVVEAEGSSYKHARYSVETDSGDRHAFLCFHKLAGLLVEGDEVRSRAVPCVEGDQRLLVQVDPGRHSIEWPGWQVENR